MKKLFFTIIALATLSICSTNWAYAQTAKQMCEKVKGPGQACVPCTGYKDNIVMRGGNGETICRIVSATGVRAPDLSPIVPGAFAVAIVPQIKNGEQDLVSAVTMRILNSSNRTLFMEALAMWAYAQSVKLPDESTFASWLKSNLGTDVCDGVALSRMRAIGFDEAKNAVLSTDLDRIACAGNERIVTLGGKPFMLMPYGGILIERGNRFGTIPTKAP